MPAFESLNITTHRGRSTERHRTQPCFCLDTVIANPMKSLLLIPLILSFTPGTSQAQSFYKDPTGLFSMRPDEKKSSYTVDRFGPVGMSIELIQPAFTMRIKAIEEGSPAAAAGGLKPGLIIESINGEKLKDIDSRSQLGDMITTAEAKDGLLKMKVADRPGGSTREVDVRIPALGAYSKTWPLDCPKSDKIVRNYAEYLKKPGSNKGFADIGMLFLLSTGEEGDLAFVREWARSQKGSSSLSWHIGYGGLALCEYYLRTGDEAVLPAIQARADKLVEMENNGGWAGRGPLAALTYGGGGGHLNAAGTLAAGYLLIAKECGANVPEETLLRVLAHFYRFAGRGNVPYGNNKPEGGFTDNGKNGKLAFVMSAAANLTPNGENSIYARARDTASQFAFYSTGYMLHGHTGGGIGEIWRSASMGLLNEKTPKHYRDFMDQRRWHYELSRRFDGSFGILGGERYDNPEWGAGYALTFTVPRKTLRLTGAPPTKFSKTYQLPERPWGTAGDDDFESIEPAALAGGKLPDLSHETIADSTGLALISKRGKPPLDRDTLLHFLHHPNYTVRTIYQEEIGKHEPALLDGLLSSDDARLRRVALEFLESKAAGNDTLTEPRLERLRAMLADPNESWFVNEIALRVAAKAPQDWLVGQVDLIIPYLAHPEWWFQHSALVALTPVVADKRCYERVLPAIGKLLQANHVYGIVSPVRWGPLPEILRQAPPEVQALARSSFKEAYVNYVEYKHPLDQVNATVNPTIREFIAETLANVPGGFDVLYHAARERSPNATLPYEKLFLKADAEQFSPELKKEVDALIKTRLIPRFIGENREFLLKEQANEHVPASYYYREARVLGLAELYRRIGIHDYDWHDFGPAPAKMKWHYLSFDPPETLAWDSTKPRYRDVSFPKGTEDWFKPSFDPARAGWKTGLAPFGANNGKLITKEGSCPLDFCRHGEPMQTLWEKEVLLLRGIFKFPAFKEGHRYELRLGGMSHVGAGEGGRIYINGKLFFENKSKVDRRGGAKPFGGELHRDWWPDFQGGETEIAYIGFMGNHNGWRSRHLMIWVQEMKFPPLGEKEILQSTTTLPMTSSAWQALQDTEANDLDPEEGKFLWDGEFKSNPKAVGSWTTVGVVNSLAEFDPNKLRDGNRAPLQEINLKSDGTTDDLLWIWSGDILMDLRKNQALKMEIGKHDGTEYLFIEAGGFNTKHGDQWKSPWFILKRP
jgi:hypothetical protein